MSDDTLAAMGMCNLASSNSELDRSIIQSTREIRELREKIRELEIRLDELAKDRNFKESLQVVGKDSEV